MEDFYEKDGRKKSIRLCYGICYGNGHGNRCNGRGDHLSNGYRCNIRVLGRA